MLDPKCTHRVTNKKKPCRCFEDRSYWKPMLDEAGGEEGLTLERMGEMLNTTRMCQCKHVQNALAKVKKILDERGYVKTDFFEGE